MNVFRHPGNRPAYSQPVGDWFLSRVAAFVWSWLAVWVFLGNVDLGPIEGKHPYWRWAVVAYVFVCFECFLLDRYAAMEIARRRGEVLEPFGKRLLIVLIGGWVGAISWTIALIATVGGWLAGGGWGLAIGALIAKLTYIPWIIAVIREARRKPPSRPAGPNDTAARPVESAAKAGSTAAPAATAQEPAAGKKA